MAKETAQEKKDRLEALAVQKESNALLKEQNRLQREINKEKQKESGLNKTVVNDLKDWSNILSSILKNEKTSVYEKRKALSIDKKLVDLAEKAYTFDVKGLGTTSKSEKIQAQILKNEQNRRILGLQLNRIGTDGSKIQHASNEAIQHQIDASRKVTEELERQKAVAEEIEGNKIANSFKGIGDMLDKIPLLSALAPSFKKAEEAAREAGSEVTLFGKGMADASDYSKGNLEELFGEGVSVEFTMNQDHVDDLEQKAAVAQAKIDKGGLKKGKVEELQKVVKKGGDAKVGKKQELFGAAAQKSLEAGTSKLKGVSVAGASMKAGLEKMLPMLGKIALAFALDSLFEANKNVTAFQKNLGVSRDEAKKLNKQINLTAATTDNLRVTIKNLNIALGALNDAYGTAYMFNEKTLTTSAEILDSKLMEGEATARLSQSARLNGMEMKDALLTQESAVNAVNKEHNTRISLKSVLKDANKVTGQIRAQLAANPEAIAKAVMQAKALGMELNQVAASSKQMLDFESSIEAELTAELMLGRQLNLEKARMAALTGDYETVAKEITKNVGDFGDFTKLNVLQQDALAKSVGMTSDQLSTQLMKKADLDVLAQEALDKGDEQHAKDLMALSTQEKFEKAVLKTKEAFVSVMAVVEPIVFLIGGVFETMGYMVGSVTALVGAFTGANEQLTAMQSIIGAMVITYGLLAMWSAAVALNETIKAAALKSGEKSLVRQGLIMLKNLAISIADAVAKVVGMSAATLGVAAAIAIAAGVTAYAFLGAKKAGDVRSPADGKTQISTKEGGLFELSKNDDVAAGPGILDKLKGALTGGPMGLMGGMMGMLNPFAGLTSIVSNMAEAIISKVDIIVGNIEQKLIESTPMTTSKKEGPTSIEKSTSSSTTLEQKLESIRKLLAGKQNISLNVNNKLKYDAFSENTTSYLNGKAAQEQINDSSFV